MIDELSYEITVEENQKQTDNIKKRNVEVILSDGTRLYVQPKYNNPETIAFFEKTIKENKD